MEQEIIIRFLLAALWGSIIGAEREYNNKSAGFRTIIMISIGACFFTMMSYYIGSPGSTDRIASNIVTGIGFLGAGVIFKGDNRVNGITTAATIWVVAAVGMGIGAGYYFASGIASILVIIILAALPYVENMIDKFNQSKIYIIDCDYSLNAKPEFENLLRKYHLKFKAVKEVKTGSDLSVSWHVHGSSKHHKEFIAEAMSLPMLKRFEY